MENTKRIERDMLEFAAKTYVDKSWYKDDTYMESFLSTWNPLVNDTLTNTLNKPAGAWLVEL